MKISKEVRIGVLVSVAILTFFIGFNFLKNSSLFSNDQEYYCFYKNVGGLQNSAVVQTMGLNIGHVSAMRIENGSVKVTIAVDRKINLPKGTKAKLESSLLGTPTIKLEMGKGPEKLEPGAELPSEVEGGIVDNVSSELTPRLRELKGTISAIDTALDQVHTLLGPENQKNISDAIRSVKVTADNLAILSGELKDEGGEIKAILANARSITGNLAKSNDTITQIISHVNSLSRHLDNAPVQKTVTELHSAVTHLNEVIEKINKSEGSLGMLINNKDLYHNLNSTLGSLNKLLEDLKAHPSRYINVNIIGGKKKD